MAFCYCSQAWYHARFTEEKHTGNAPQLASGSLVLSFPGHYHAKGALSLILTAGKNHEINWERPGKRPEFADEFKPNMQLHCWPVYGPFLWLNPLFKYFQDKIGALEWHNCPAKLWAVAFMAKRLESARSTRDVLKNNSGKISCWSECLPQPLSC